MKYKENSRSFEDPSAARVQPGTEPSDSSQKKAWLIILIVLCIACVGAFFLSDTFYNMVHHQTTYTLEDTDIAFEYSPDGVTGVYPFQNMILRINSSGVQAVDTKGAVCWDVPYTMSSPSLAQAGEYAAIADLKGNQICIVGVSGQLGTITAEGPITYCTVNEKGNTAVILNSNNNHVIIVYDVNGNVLVRRETYASEDGIPIAIALNADGTRMATSYMIFTETELKSAVTLFNLTHSASQTADKIAGNYSYSNTLVTELHYVDDMLMYVGDNRIGGIRVSGNTEQIWDETISYKILSLDFGAKFVAILYGEGMPGVSVGADKNLIAYGPEGTRLLEINVESPQTLNVSEDIIVYQDGVTYNAIDISGIRQWYYTPDTAPLKLFTIGNGHAAFVTADSIHLMKTVGLDETTK